MLPSLPRPHLTHLRPAPRPQTLTPRRASSTPTPPPPPPDTTSQSGASTSDTPLDASTPPPESPQDDQQGSNLDNLDPEETSIRIRSPHGRQYLPCGHLLMKCELPSDYENVPKNILEEIVWSKWTEVEEMKYIQPLAQLKEIVNKSRPPFSLRASIEATYEATGRPGVIAEVKKASPSKGLIRKDFNPEEIAIGYEDGGASGLSILTDPNYFEGSFTFLRNINNTGVKTPKLCKDFIVNAYQIYKARAFGADAVLLIAAVLGNNDMRMLMKVAHTAGLECLVEIHSERELARVLMIEEITKCLIGINNRDLKTFKVDLSNTRRIMSSDTAKRALDMGCLFVSESGIFTYDDISYVKDYGVKAVLVGESLMRQPDV